MFAANSAQMRFIDERMTSDFSYPSILLMETAGRRSAECIAELFPLSNFLILIGPGNNGGDGLVIARYLHRMGKSIRLLFSSSPDVFEHDSRINYQIVKHLGLPVHVFDPKSPTDVRSLVTDGTILIDALLGVRAYGPLRSPLLELVNTLRPLHVSVVAIDLPTGLIADSGKVETAPLRCDYTITFQLPKICHFTTPAAGFCGKVIVMDIGIFDEAILSAGISTHVMDHETIRRWYVKRDLNVHKGTYGHVLAVGGSKGKSGAIALTSRASLEMGAGLCTAFIPGSVSCAFHRTTLENMSIPYGSNNTAYLNETAAEVCLSYLDDKHVLAIGPGMGNNADTLAFLKGVMTQDKIPVILDADALNLVAENPELWEVVSPEGYQTRCILTPHPGEMARLMNLTVLDIQEQRLEMARLLSAERNVVVVLKGAGTVVATPNGTAYISSVGNPGMASAGVGDVLTGVIAGLIAQGYNLLKASVMGVYLHAISAEIVVEMFGHEGVTASKISRYLGAALKKVIETDHYQQLVLR
jgi:NAD(P)H-hydrate epimerase